MLFDRYLLELGFNRSDATPLDRLAHVGTTGIGALTFLPETNLEVENGSVELD